MSIRSDRTGTHLQRQNNLPLLPQTPLQLYAAPEPVVLLTRDLVAPERDMQSLPLLYASLLEYIPQPRPPPLAVHDRSIQPVDALDLLEQRAHRVPAVPRALQRADELVLGEVGAELGDGQSQGVRDEAGDGDGVRVGGEEGDGAVVAVVEGVSGGEEAGAVRSL